MSAGWIIWIILAVITFVMSITWFLKRKAYKNGHFYKTSDVITLYSIPKIAPAVTVLLVVFVFVPVNKLHLLWSYPTIYFSINYLMSRRVMKEDKQQVSDNNGVR